MRYRTLELSTGHHEAVSEALLSNPDGVIINCSYDGESGMLPVSFFFHVWFLIIRFFFTCVYY